MSFYNMMNGVQPSTFFILPMLGKHPNEYPRFRDCFLKDPDHPEYDNYIHIYTRTGGGNREGYEVENDEMKNHPNFVVDFDDSFDCTYASWVFSVPEKWESDFNKIVNGEIKEVSKEYQLMVRNVFPKLNERFDEIWKEETKVEEGI